MKGQELSTNTPCNTLNMNAVAGICSYNHRDTQRNYL